MIKPATADRGSALIVTTTLPPTTGQDMQGVNRRLAIFLDAIGDIGGAMRLLRIVPRRVIDEWSSRPDRLDDVESAFWGREVRVILAPREQRTETFARHYLLGLARISGQPDFYPYCGEAAGREIARELDRDPSLVFVHRLGAMCAMLGTGRRPARMFFDLDDIEHRVRLRYAVRRPFWPGKLIYALHAPAVLRAERQGSLLSRATFVCSERDRALLERLAFRNVAVVANAVQLPAAADPAPREPTVLFLGVMSYTPNVEAAERLAQRIMPIVWRSAPAARLLIAGRGSEGLSGGDDDRIEHLGFAPDLDALYARARIVCCPLRNGGGTRIKLIEAAAHGKPMVATRVGAEGLAFEDGAEILIRDDDASIAEACVRLLADDALCDALGSAARRKMRGLYEKTAMSRDVRAILEQAA